MGLFDMVGEASAENGDESQYPADGVPVCGPGRFKYGSGWSSNYDGLAETSKPFRCSFPGLQRQDGQ